MLIDQIIKGEIIHPRNSLGHDGMPNEGFRILSGDTNWTNWTPDENWISPPIQSPGSRGIYVLPIKQQKDGQWVKSTRPYYSSQTVMDLWEARSQYLTREDCRVRHLKIRESWLQEQEELNESVRAHSDLEKRFKALGHEVKTLPWDEDEMLTFRNILDELEEFRSLKSASGDNLAP